MGIEPTNKGFADHFLDEYIYMITRALYLNRTGSGDHIGIKPYTRTSDLRQPSRDSLRMFGPLIPFTSLITRRAD